MNESRDEARVDDLRRQLRALGYLDAGVDRFVLGPARDARTPTAIAALASLRVGTIAAILLGPAAATGIGTRLPGLVTGTRDAMVIALYLGAMFGLAATVFTFVASTLFARVVVSGTKGGRIISRTAGALAGTGCLAYLTLWWSSANAGFAWASPVWTAFALVVAVTISILLGHAVAITTFAVMAARHPLDDAAGGRRSSSLALVIIAGVAAFFGAAALLLLTAPSSNQPAPPPLPVISPGFRVRLLAIDGFDAQVYASLRTSGDLPELTRLLENRRAAFAADDARDPARAWTTIATGQPPEVHGVHGLETRRVRGVQGAVAAGDERGLGWAIRRTTDLLRLTTPAIASGGELRSKPIWEVAADAGLRAVVVNWWATWPAESGASGPVVVSDRATLRLERGGSLDAEIAPTELYDRLRAAWPAIKEKAARTVSASLSAAGDSETAVALRRSAELDALQIGLASAAGLEKPDLLVVYLPGLDVAQHTLLRPVEGAAPSAIAARLDALRAYYRYLDSLIAGMAAAVDGEVIIVVTEPGRLSSTAEGMIGISGGPFHGAAKVPARAVDVAPTVLYALGVPVSTELAGRAISGLFPDDFLTRFPVRAVPSYGARRPVTVQRRGDPLDQEAIERLRSLGYVR